MAVFFTPRLATSCKKGAIFLFLGLVIPFWLHFIVPVSRLTCDIRRSPFLSSAPSSPDFPIYPLASLQFLVISVAGPKLFPFFLLGGKGHCVFPPLRPLVFNLRVGFPSPPNFSPRKFHRLTFSFFYYSPF